MENNDMMFGGSGIWLFAILALLWGGNGFGGNRNNCATQDDINFGRLENQVRQNENFVQQGNTNLGNGIASLGYENAKQFGAISKEILESRYLNAQAISDASAKTSAEINALSQKLDANRIHELEMELNNVKLQQAMCGVVRYPNQITYTATNPFNCCNNGCNGNI